MRKIIYLFFAVAFMFTCSSAFAQVSAVLKAMNGTTKLNGGSTVVGHTGEIDILSYSHGEFSCSTCVKPSFSSLNLMMSLNPAVMPLKKLLINGTKLTSVDLTYIKGGVTPIEFYKIHMEDVTVENVQESGSNENPTISVSLVPDRMAWQQITDAGKKSSYGWDIINNVEWLYY